MCSKRWELEVCDEPTPFFLAICYVCHFFVESERVHSVDINFALSLPYEAKGIKRLSVFWGGTGAASLVCFS